LRSKWAAGKARGGRIPHHFTLLQIWFSPAGIKMVRDVTDEQRSRRPIFIATLWAAASWPFFRVARSLRIDSDMLVARALKNCQLTCGGRHVISRTGHKHTLGSVFAKQSVSKL
jgi:hypothetical protein